MGSHLHFYNCLCSRIMSLSRKLTTMEEQMSCDPQYLAKVSLSLHFVYMFAELVCRNYWSLITQYMFIIYMFRLGEKDRDLTSMTLIPFLRNLTYEVILISHPWSMLQEWCQTTYFAPSAFIVQRDENFSFVILLPKWEMWISVIRTLFNYYLVMRMFYIEVFSQLFMISFTVFFLNDGLFLIFCLGK